MEQYDDTFEADEVPPPSIKEIEKRLRKLGCTKEQVKRHIEQVTKSRTEASSQNTGKEPPACIGLALNRRTREVSTGSPLVARYCGLI